MSHDISIHLEPSATIDGKFCNVEFTGSTSIGLTWHDKPGFGSDYLTIWGTPDQLQGAIDELQRALDDARAELAERRALDEARAEEYEAAVKAVPA